VFYHSVPSAAATGTVVDPTPQSSVICYYDPASGAIFSAIPGLPGYDVANSAYLYGGSGGGGGGGVAGLPVVPSGGYGLAGRAGSASTGHTGLTVLTHPQPQQHYLQRLA